VRTADPQVERHAPPPRSWSAAAFLLLFAMVALSLVLWIGVPLAWMWLASLVVPDKQGWYLALLVVVPLTMVAVGFVLYRVNRVYVRVSGEPIRPEHTAWLKSQSGDRTTRPPKRAIDVIMACSVSLAGLLFAFWFFFLAGSPLP
jgi:hypothetical protein